MKYYSTREMMAYYFTKLLQGAFFSKFRSTFQGIPLDTPDIEMLWDIPKVMEVPRSQIGFKCVNKERLYLIYQISSNNQGG